jgi:Tol biopolymer transport system component
VSRLPGKLLYVRNGNIHVLSPSLSDGQLTSDGTTPIRYSMLSVSPDHHWLAYIRFTLFASDLWVRNLVTGKSYKLTSDTDPRDVHNNLWAAWPSWAADGKTLLLSWDAQKRHIAESEARPVDLAIWRLSTKGQPIAQLTSPAIGAGGDTDVATRPHSEQYVYVRWDYNSRNNQPFSQLVVADPTIPNARYYLTPRGGRTLDPAWDPVGKHLTFVRMLPSGIEQIVEASIIHSVHGPVLGPRRVIDSGRVAQPAFSPDGRWISYVKADGTGFAIYLERTSGGAAFRVDAAGSGIDATTRPVWTK